MSTECVVFVSQRPRREALYSESLVGSLEMIQCGQVYWQAFRFLQVVLELFSALCYEPPLLFHAGFLVCKTILAFHGKR